MEAIQHRTVIPRGRNIYAGQVFEGIDTQLDNINSHFRKIEIYLEALSHRVIQLEDRVRKLESHQEERSREESSSYSTNIIHWHLPSTQEER